MVLEFLGCGWYREGGLGERFCLINSAERERSWPKGNGALSVHKARGGNFEAGWGAHGGCSGGRFSELR